MSLTGAARAAAPQPIRDAGRRKADVLDTLVNSGQVWLATGGASGAHMVPLGCVWDGAHLVMATRERHRTVRNLRENHLARAAFGDPADVVLMDGPVEIVPPDGLPSGVAVPPGLPLDPARVPGCVYLFLTPRRVLAWRHRGEIPDRTLMRDGRWLA
ncbi:pyridoxamine 5'-phosphate oxidase family protein [Spongiactinospora sp. TRM90649]|uniref:pyridoxamine 5'-phosphate oxidase family protein n=1 Tax=Spongiactinospora sp. TRM90649 TaxID=3031114 RepID=UPI0023F93BDB|nr:pyridoxamine 5'-phosphate oxidase family protein [Spongiactinospora sp. TRM90649]MDF5753661.1 pyridoxamine 5'-phosphate oxidase family protein [Spongiactinospora sp. TRM90649]